MNWAYRMCWTPLSTLLCLTPSPDPFLESSAAGLFADRAFASWEFHTVLSCFRMRLTRCGLRKGWHGNVSFACSVMKLTTPLLLLNPLPILLRDKLRIYRSKNLLGRIFVTVCMSSRAGPNR